MVTIYPFTEGNASDLRLIVNLILLQHGYVIASIKGDYDSRMQYYQALETSQTKNNKENFLIFLYQNEKQSLERYRTIIAQ